MKGLVHAPWTEQGCELFVKLCQFQSNDKERVIVDTSNAAWRETNHPDLSVLALHSHGDEFVSIYQLAAGAEAVAMNSPRGAEILLLEGSFEEGKKTYPERSWLRLPTGSHQILSSERGCRFYCKTGRLTHENLSKENRLCYRVKKQLVNCNLLN